MLSIALTTWLAAKLTNMYSKEYNPTASELKLAHHILVAFGVISCQGKKMYIINLFWPVYFCLLKRLTSSSIIDDFQVNTFLTMERIRLASQQRLGVLQQSSLFTFTADV